MMMALFIGSSQTRWSNPMEESFLVVQNQGFPEEIGKTYYRLPDRAHGKVQDPLWKLSRNSAGLALEFDSDADEIKVRYVVTGPKNMDHMPSTGVSGVDLYSREQKGEWRRNWGSYNFGDTITYSFVNKVPNPGENTEYRLYLPLYNTVKWMEIGVPEGKTLKFKERSAEKPVVVYGTSIAQGACASRPGMAWVNILNRSLDIPVVDIGFSGNGKLAPEVIDFINEIDGQIYILDCLPNLLGKSNQEIKELATAAVKQIRSAHNSPILLVEHIGNSNMLTDMRRYEDVANLNRGLRQAFDQLKAEGVKDVYYLSQEEIGMVPDDYVDYIHPSDLGMDRQARAITKKVSPILKKQK